MTHGHFRVCLRFSFAELAKPAIYIFFRNLHLLSFPTIYSLPCFSLKWRAYEFFPCGHSRRSGTSKTTSKHLLLYLQKKMARKRHKNFHAHGEKLEKNRGKQAPIYFKNFVAINIGHHFVSHKSYRPCHSASFHSSPRIFCKSDIGSLQQSR